MKNFCYNGSRTTQSPFVTAGAAGAARTYIQIFPPPPPPTHTHTHEPLSVTDREF